MKQETNGALQSKTTLTVSPEESDKKLKVRELLNLKYLRKCVIVVYFLGLAENTSLHVISRIVRTLIPL